MTFRTTSCAAFLCLALAHASPAQTVRAPGDEVRAVRLDAPLRIDGRLDEEVYAAVPPIDGFVQQLPVEGVPATEGTDVWIFFDDDNLYIAARCLDSQADRITANELRRDNGNIFQYNDNFSVAHRHVPRPAERLLLPDHPDRRRPRPGDHRRPS